MAPKKRLYDNDIVRSKTPARLPGLGELYQRYAPQLRFFIARRLRLKHKTEDLVSETFICMLKYPPAEELLRADNYLWRISWRLVNAENRRTRRDEVQLSRLVNDAPDWLLGQSSALASLDAAESLGVREQIRQCLEGLAPKERQAVTLAFMGYPKKEIAVRMGISVNSVHDYLRRGYMKLKSIRSPEDN